MLCAFVQPPDRMKTSLLTETTLTMGTRQARERMENFKASYAALYQNLDACMDFDNRVCRDLGRLEHHRWCSAADLDVNEHTPVAEWFRGLMLHIGNAVRLQMELASQNKNGRITGMLDLQRHLPEDAGRLLTPYMGGGVAPLALMRCARSIDDERFKKFFLTGDRKAAVVVVNFDQPNVYLRNLISSIVTMELYRNSGALVMRNRGEDYQDWFERVEQAIGIKPLRRGRDKSSTWPRKGARYA